jgi:hypothetical protein
LPDGFCENGLLVQSWAKPESVFIFEVAVREAIFLL